MKTNIVRRAAVAGGGVLALVAITTGAMAMSSGPAETPVTAANAEEPASAADVTTTDEDGSQMGLCGEGEVPELTVERHPDETTRGAATVLEAMREITPAAAASDDLVQTPFGSVAQGAPIWVETGGATYVVQQAPAGGWFASPATHDGCVDLQELQELPTP